MHTNQNHKTTYRIITALLPILWVAFIFSNSMDNADASTLKSGAVLALLRRILGSEGAALTEFIVRKTARFTGFIRTPDSPSTPIHPESPLQLPVCKSVL